MSKINFTYEKKDYSLEFNRQSVRVLEGQGFVLDEVTTKPMTMVPMLFYGAFMKNHRGIKRNLVDEIYDSMKDKTGIIHALIELYAETLNSLTDDNDDEGNVSWAVVS